MGGDHEAGGSGALAELIDNHGAALYCDFQSFYQLDLVEVVRTRPPLFVLALVEGLPDSGSYGAQIQGGSEFRGWGIDRHLIATLIDVTTAAGGVTTKGSKTPFKQQRPGKKQTDGGTPLLQLIGKSFGGE